MPLGKEVLKLPLQRTRDGVRGQHRSSLASVLSSALLQIPAGYPPLCGHVNMFSYCEVVLPGVLW